MTGFPSLQELVSAELARRQEASSTFLPFCYTVHDTADAMCDSAAAVSAVEEEHVARLKGEMKRAPTIAPDIVEAVDEALAAAHPKHFARLGRLSIIKHVIVTSGMRHAPVPEAIEDAMPSPGVAPPAARPDKDEVAEHYAERIRRMREEQF